MSAHPCVHDCVVCLVKDGGQQGTGWVQSRGGKIMVFSFFWGGVGSGGPVGLHVTHYVCIHGCMRVCVCLWVGVMDYL